MFFYFYFIEFYSFGVLQFIKGDVGTLVTKKGEKNMAIGSWQENMLKQLKEEMKAIISNFNASNIMESEQTIMNQFKFSKTLLTIPVELESVDKKEASEQNSIKDNESEETYEKSLETLASSFDESEAHTSYEMKRNLVGGVLIGAKNPYVPESIIREKGFEHGDYISTEFSGYKGNRPLYDFKLDKKGNGEDSGITVFPYAIVRYDAEINSFYIEENISGETIMFEDVPQKLIIPDHMANKFILRTGDIVDVSWYGDNVSKFSVSWKHRFEDIEDIQKREEKRMLEYRKQNKNANNIASDKELEKLSTSFKFKNLEDSNLEGLTVAVVGGESFKSSYTKLIEDNGGKAYIIPENSHLIRMTSAIKKSNLVLVITENASHNDMFAAKERAKKYKVRFKAVKGLGKTSLLQTLIEEKRKLFKKVTV